MWIACVHFCVYYFTVCALLPNQPTDRRSDQQALLCILAPHPLRRFVQDLCPFNSRCICNISLSAQSTLSCLLLCNIPPTYRPTTLVTDRLPAHSSSFFALICAGTYKRLVDPHQLDGDCILSPTPLLIACLTHSCASSFFAGIYPLLVDIKIYDIREKNPLVLFESHPKT